MNILKEKTFSVLPSDLVEKAKNMSKIYEYLYCIENVLRNFLDSHSEKNNFIIPASIKKTISERKIDESKNKWIALRGNNDFYYIDFKDIGGIINNNWDLFKNNFPSQIWIIAKIEELARCRNLIAHNSYIDDHELDVIRTSFNSILRQLQITPEARIVNAIIPDDRSLFVKGLKYSQLFKQSEIVNAPQYILNYPPDMQVAPMSVEIFYHQAGGVSFHVCYQNSRVDITPEFKIGYADEYNLKGDIVFQLGLHDIDEDGIDEIFICLQDKEEPDNGVQISVIKHFPPAFEMHSYRAENWQNIGDFEAQMVLGEPIAHIEKNSITVPRNLRGFYWEWTYTKGSFLYTGNF